MPMMTRLYVNISVYVTIGQPPFRKIRGQRAALCRGPTAYRIMATPKYILFQALIFVNFSFYFFPSSVFTRSVAAWNTCRAL